MWFLQNKYGAQRALQRNGELVSRQLMVGVQLLDKRMRSAALEITDGASSNDATIALPRPQPQLLRPHRIDASASQVPCPLLAYLNCALPALHQFEAYGKLAAADAAATGGALHTCQSQGVCAWLVTP